jgi:excisionase family DNA binding protein
MDTNEPVSPETAKSPQLATDRTVRRWIEDGKLAAVRFSEAQQGHVRITDSDLREFVEHHRFRRG